MEVIYCKKCHLKKRVESFESVCEKMSKLDQVSEVNDYCLSYCGPGRGKFFCAYDDELIVKDTLDELISEIGEK